MGCQMNKADSQSLAQGLEAKGYVSVATPEEADLIVVNTCVVRQGAEDRALNKLASLRPLKTDSRRPVIALTGCLVDSNVPTLRRRFPHVDYFLKPGETMPLIEALGSSVAELRCLSSGPTAFVPVIQGCDNFCTYCIVPYRRGRERSTPVEDIVCQVRTLAARGVKEVTLVGQNVDSYGHDLPDHSDLADLLALLNATPGLARLRFITSHPRDMTDKLIGAVATLDKVCPHICLPVQSGDDAVLQAMGRGYTAGDYRDLVDRIRRAIPSVALSTDVIAGFPGETETQFQNTYDLLAELRFDTVHTASYSPRAGTEAARTLPDDVPSDVKKKRLQRLEVLQEAISAEINAAYLGQTVELLVEGTKQGKRYGRTRTDKLAFFPQPASPGDLVKVRIEKASPWSLQGDVSL